MRRAAAGGPLLERSAELARIESALAEARDGTRQVRGGRGAGRDRQDGAARGGTRRGGRRGMRVLRSRGTELERDFAFGVARQLFEPPLAEASELERVDLLQAAAGVAAGFLGLPGAPHPRPCAVVGRRPFLRDPARALLAVRESGRGPAALRGRRRCALGGRSVPALPGLSAHAPPGAEASRFWWRVARASRAPMPSLLATVTTDPSAEVVRLPPLTRTAVAQLVESHGGKVR